MSYFVLHLFIHLREEVTFPGHAGEPEYERPREDQSLSQVEDVAYHYSLPRRCDFLYNCDLFPPVFHSLVSANIHHACIACQRSFKLGFNSRGPYGQCRRPPKYKQLRPWKTFLSTKAGFPKCMSFVVLWAYAGLYLFVE